MGDRQAQPTADRVRSIGLPVVLCIALYLVNFDIGAANLAVSNVQADFRVPLPVVIWFVDGYVLAMACSVLPSGMLCDKFGAKRMLLIGVTGFAAASLLCGVAWNPGWLIAARIVQGCASGIIIPASIATVAAAYDNQRDRARLISFLAIAGGLGIASSPLIAGWLVAWLGWRAIFLVNVPLIGVAMALLLTTKLPPHLVTNERLPLGSMGSLVLILGAVTFLLIEWPKLLEGDLSLPAIAVMGLVAIILFKRSERAVTVPLLPQSLFWNHRLAVLCVIGALTQACAFAIMFLISLQLARWEGLPVDKVGFTFIWLTAPLLLASVGLAFVMHRFDTRSLAVTGLVLSALGLFLLAISTGSVVPAFPFLGVGLAILTPPISLGVLRSVEPHLAGTATGMLNAARQLGALVGIAISGAAIVFVMYHRLGDVLPFNSLMRAAAGDLAGVSPGNAQQAHDAFDVATQLVFITIGAAMLANALAAWLLLKAPGDKNG